MTTELTDRIEFAAPSYDVIETALRSGSSAVRFYGKAGADVVVWVTAIARDATEALIVRGHTLDGLLFIAKLENHDDGSSQRAVLVTEDNWLAATQSSLDPLSATVAA